MKIQDITVGQFIVAQDEYGGATNAIVFGSPVLTVGTAYKVVAVDPDDEFPEQPIAIDVPNAHTKFWVDPNAFTALEGSL